MRKVLWVASIAVALPLFASLWLFLTGTVVVRDRTAGVASAVLTNGERERRLHRLPGGMFVGIPTWDAEVEIRCRDGSSRRNSYVSRGDHLHLEATGQPCSELKLMARGP